jgi:hypothetical protein
MIIWKKHIITTFIMLFCISPILSFAKDKGDLRVFISTGLSADVPSGDTVMIPMRERPDSIMNKSLDINKELLPSLGFQFSAGADYFLSENNFLTIEAKYMMNSGIILQKDNFERIFQQGGKSLVDEHNIVYFFQTLGVGLNYNYELFEDFSIYAGGAYMYNIGSNYVYETKTYLKDGEDKILLHQTPGKSGNLSENEKIQDDVILVNFGFDYGFKARKNIDITVGAGVQTTLNSLLAEKEVNVAGIYLKAAGKYRFNLNNERNSLYTSVRFKTLTNGNYLSRNKFFYNRTITKKAYPILNQIFFDKGSSDIPVRYHTLSQFSTRSFHPKKIKASNPVEMYHHVLNIVGFRMQNNPLYNLTLVSKMNSDLDVERKETLKNYLRYRWGISSSRINIEGVDNHLAANAIVFKPKKNSELLFLPVSIKDSSSKLLTEQLVFNFDISDTTGMEKWRFELFDGYNSLVSRTSKAKFSEISYVIDNVNPDKLRYNLLIKGREGYKDNIIRSDLPIKKEYQNGYRYIHYLVWDDPSDYELNAINTIICKKINAINNYKFKRVEINSYAEASKYSKTNEKLSKYRAMQVKKEAGLGNGMINIYGGKQLYKENKYPEYSFYNHLVEIVVN